MKKNVFSFVMGLIIGNVVINPFIHIAYLSMIVGSYFLGHRLQ